MDGYTIVKYHFETSQGPGHVTLAVSDSEPETIEKTGQQLLESFSDWYQEIELTGHEIVPKQ